MRKLLVFFATVIALMVGISMPVMAQEFHSGFSFGMEKGAVQVASLDLGLMSTAVDSTATPTDVHQCVFLTSQAVRQIDWQRGEGRREVNIDWNKQAIVVSDTEKVITMGNRDGETDTCTAPAGIAYVVDKTTWVAESVFICLNPVEEPKDWKVSGLFIAKKEESVGLLDQQFKLLNGKLDLIRDGTSHIRQGVDELMARPPAATKLDVEAAVKAALQEGSKTAPIVPMSQKTWWQRNRGWAIPVGILVGGGIAYAAFHGGGHGEVRGRPKV